MLSSGFGANNSLNNLDNKYANTASFDKQKVTNNLQKEAIK